ncbi:MAG TPA: ChrR family anti-sigma-E factor [Stellaceae bacterium]|nr:ChrR family anti-sigma-E factor [Stellaceae bacterium]
MTPRHHPSDATLLAYAAGGLGDGLSLVVTSHLSFCPECRANIADAEAIGGMMLEELGPVALAVGARERALTKLDAPPAVAETPRAAPKRSDPLVPSALAHYLRGGLDGIEWHFLAPGLHQWEVLPQSQLSGGNLRMLRIATGKKLPRHGHTGTELTLVLRGSYSDELGRFGRGDVAETDEDIVHQPVSDREEDCICLIATEGPLKFDSVLARLVQRFTGL